MKIKDLNPKKLKLKNKLSLNFNFLISKVILSKKIFKKKM